MQKLRKTISGHENTISRLKKNSTQTKTNLQRAEQRNAELAAKVARLEAQITDVETKLRKSSQNNRTLLNELK